jgi:hypothetical protein
MEWPITGKMPGQLDAEDHALPKKAFDRRRESRREEGKKRKKKSSEDE